MLIHTTKQILDQWGADGWELVQVGSRPDRLGQPRRLSQAPPRLTAERPLRSETQDSSGSRSVPDRSVAVISARLRPGGGSRHQDGSGPFSGRVDGDDRRRAV